ncbi:MAG: hypothetical protein HYZ88_03030 [Candidatus Omnitrophica bacterium]|nr:hypothetical protein [Candidatus Omnitrophota bacterium]
MLDVRGSLRFKLLAVTLGLLALLTAGSLLIIRHYFGQQLRQEAIREVRVSARVLDSIVERSGAQLMDRGRILSDLPSLQSALAKDHRQLEPLLVEVKAVRAANLLWATDVQGAVLASTGEYPPVGENLLKNPLVRAALEGRPTLGFDLFGDAWWLVLSLPVRDPKTNQPMGSVSLSLLIGDAYLARLSELLGTKVGFLWGEHQLWSEGWPEGLRTQIASHLTQGFGKEPRESSLLQEGRMIWLARSVTGGEPPIAAGPIAVMGKRLDETVIQRSARAIAWIAIFTMGVGLFLMTWATRPIFMELERAQTQLLRAEKLASIGQLAAGVAHELNNPLMVIMGNTQMAGRLLAKKPPPSPATLVPELQELIQDLDKESHRCKLIVNNLLDFSRIKPPTRTDTVIDSLLDECLKLIGYQVSLQSIQVVKQYGKGLPAVRVDPDQFKQVFVNLIVNAVQAMPLGGTLTLETSSTPTHFRIRIQDTGVGIPEEEIQKVFDPFYTTKEPGLGTGLGLTLSHTIVQRHQGTLTITSQVGKGTQVTIDLPL